MTKSKDDAPVSVSALVRSASVRFCIALAVGVVVSLPVLLPYVPFEFQQDYRFSGFPSDDETLVEWVDAQSNAFNCNTARSGNGILNLRYARRGISAETLYPPMQDLGYEGLASGSFSRGISFPLLLREAIFALVVLLSTQGGFLFVGIWWIHSANRKGTPLPLLFRAPILRAGGYGVVLGVCLVAMGIGYDALLKLLPFEDSNTAGVWSAITELTLVPLIMVLVFGSIVAPICEELFFRGAVFGSFQAADRPVAGGVFSALLFAFAHLDPVNLIPFFLFGLGTAWAYHRTRSLLTVVIAHALNNAVAFVLILW